MQSPRRVDPTTPRGGPVSTHDWNHEGKTIGFLGSICLLFNNSMGAGVAGVPLIFVQGGYLVPTLAMILFAFLAVLASSWICEAMRFVPGNERFKGRVEYITVVEYFLGRKWRRLGALSLICALQTRNIASIVVTAQGLDHLLLTFMGRMCGLSLNGAGLVCRGNDGAALNSNFEGTFISEGFGLSLLVAVPLGVLNMADNIPIQIATSAICVVSVGMWLTAMTSYGSDFRSLDLSRLEPINTQPYDSKSHAESLVAESNYSIALASKALSTTMASSVGTNGLAAFTGALASGMVTMKQDLGNEVLAVKGTKKKGKEKASTAPKKEVEEEASPAPKKEVEDEASPAPQKKVEDEASPAPKKEAEEEASPAPKKEVDEEGSPEPVEDNSETMPLSEEVMPEAVPESSSNMAKAMPESSSNVNSSKKVGGFLMRYLAGDQNGDGNYREVVGITLSSFSFAMTVPSWCNEKAKRVSIRRSIWYSGIACLVCYLGIGITAAALFGHYITPQTHFLTLMAEFAREKADYPLMLSVYCFPLLAALSSVPISCIVCRYNLLEQKVCRNAAMANLFAVVLPWVLAVPVQTMSYGSHLQDLLNHGSLIFGTLVNFIIPFALYLGYRATLRRKQKMDLEEGLLTDRSHRSSGSSRRGKSGGRQQEQLEEKVKGYWAIPPRLATNKQLKKLARASLIITTLAFLATLDVAFVKTN